MQIAGAAAATVPAVMFVVACGGGGSDSAPGIGAPPPPSIVVIGDSIADISGVVTGHRFCTDDPWTYGLSVYLIPGNTDSLVPFHPTPNGQAAIAAVLRKSFPQVSRSARRSRAPLHRSGHQ